MSGCSIEAVKEETPSNALYSTYRTSHPSPLQLPVSSYSTAAVHVFVAMAYIGVDTGVGF